MFHDYTDDVLGDIDKVLISRHEIAARIAQLGTEIRRDLDDLSRDGEIVVVPVLTGSIIFVADLMRELPNKMRISVIAASSYPGKSTHSKGVELAGNLPNDFAGKHVLIVDDILDSGSTIRAIRESDFAAASKIDPELRTAAKEHPCGDEHPVRVRWIRHSTRLRCRIRPRL